MYWFLIHLFIGVLITLHSHESQAKEVRVYNSFSIPLDPANLNTMAEYNLSLCLFRTLFNLKGGDARPSSQFLTSWIYDDEKNLYRFNISPEAKWSDGKPLKASEIKFSLDRLKKVAQHQYSGIVELLTDEIDKSFLVKSDDQFEILVKGPSIELFKRLAAAMIVIVRPDQVDSESLRVNTNSISLAGYTVNSKLSTNSELVLKVNLNYIGFDPNMPQSIRMRHPIEREELYYEILHGESWPNLVLEQGMVKTELIRQLKTKFNIWSRPVDRVVLMIPTEKNYKHGREVLQFLGAKIAQNGLNLEEYSLSEFARSLQPVGYTLHKQIKYDFYGKISDLAKKHYRVAYLPGISISEIQELTKNIGLNLNFSQLDLGTYLKEHSIYDFFLYTFGAADPSPVIWLNLVLENEFKFIGDYDNQIRNEYRSILKIPNDSERDKSLSDLIARAGSLGYYLPLIHSSSFALYSRTISGSRIDISDETIDISELRFVQ